MVEGETREGSPNAQLFFKTLIMPHFPMSYWHSKSYNLSQIQRLETYTLSFDREKAKSHFKETHSGVERMCGHLQSAQSLHQRSLPDCPICVPFHIPSHSIFLFYFSALLLKVIKIILNIYLPA